MSKGERIRSSARRNITARSDGSAKKDLPIGKPPRSMQNRSKQYPQRSPKYGGTTND